LWADGVAVLNQNTELTEAYRANRFAFGEGTMNFTRAFYAKLTRLFHITKHELQAILSPLFLLADRLPFESPTTLPSDLLHPAKTITPKSNGIIHAR